MGARPVARYFVARAQSSRSSFPPRF